MYLVTGGYDGNNHLFSTEILLNGEWTIVGELPSPRNGIRAVSIDNNIIATGKTSFLEHLSDSH